MLVARSYSYSSSQKRARSNEEKQPVHVIVEKQSPPRSEPRGFGWRPASYERTAEQYKSSSPIAADSRSANKSKTARGDHATATPSDRNLDLDNVKSRPMDVPSRTSRVHSLAPTSAPQQVTHGFRNEALNRRSSQNGPNVRKGIPSSVSAVLAGTQIPKRKKHPHRDLLRTNPRRRQSLSELRAEWEQADLEELSFGSSPTMDFLLSLPDDDEMLVGSVVDDGSPSFSSLPSRVVSTDSIPSLEPDLDSASLSYSPATRLRRRNTLDRPSKFSPRSVEIDAHPLDEDRSDDDETERTSLDTASVTSSSKRSDSSSNNARKEFKRDSRSARASFTASSFKSNLTASFAALKSAARSFSNFAAPSIAPDDHVSRGLLGIPYHPEMRPRPMQGTPNAAMRRYMNPRHYDPAGEFHLHGAVFDHLDLESVASHALSNELLAGTSPPEAVIAMQSLDSGRSSQKMSATEAGRAMDPATAGPHKLRREPRENNEFLRICVLEMNMRRSGKMEGPVGVGHGRRAWWLPPREFDVNSRTRSSDKRSVTQEVPQRWMPASA